MIYIPHLNNPGLNIILVGNNFLYNQLKLPHIKILVINIIMKRKKNSNYFESINSVINGLTGNLRLEKGLKVSSVSKLWADIVGPRFKKTSKIYSIYENKGSDIVLIAVNSSAVAQELSFYKKDILKKLHKVGENFGFNIKEINFSTKYWKKEEKQEEKKVRVPPDEDLECIEIPDELLEDLKVSLDEKSIFNEKIRQRFLKTVIKDLKTRLWMKKNNYPACKKCGIPVAVNYPDQEKLCPSCKH